MGMVAPRMRVRFSFDRDRHKTHLAVFDAALGDHGLRKLPHHGGFATQDSDFETIVVIEMNMHRGDLKVVMRVMRIGQPPRQFPRVMIENIGERRDALTAHAVIDPRLLKTQAREIAHSLGSVLVTIAFYELGEFDGELIGHADRDPLHRLNFPILDRSMYDDYSIFSYIIAPNKGMPPHARSRARRGVGVSGASRRMFAAFLAVP